jgi:hypothetical protein
LRAIAGLYLALAAFWLYAAFNDKYRDAALLTTILFAGGLAAGRCVSLITDGQPAPVLLFYLAVEFAVVLVAYWIFRLPGSGDQKSRAMPRRRAQGPTNV